ncbi:MAG: class I SAM-dependent methyltransferase, partial [Thermoanaerobaculia bacterium]|nr:class I SAM-dependent methyltransferase [Thermoanaerobaculia bacterium]
LNPVVAEEARERLHSVVTGDIAEVDPGGPFDAILALELFEHLPRPEPVLNRLGSLLRPGGRIVLSVPNVGHHSVVRDLLAGRWDYLPIGLLCYTHYRFFTRRTLEDWIRRAGFHRFTLVPQTTPVPEEMLELPLAGIDRESLATKGFWALIEG